MTGRSLETFMVPAGENLLPGEQDLTQVKIPPVEDMMLIKTVSISLAWYVCILSFCPLKFIGLGGHRYFTVFEVFLTRQTYY